MLVPYLRHDEQNQTYCCFPPFFLSNVFAICCMYAAACQVFSRWRPQNQIRKWTTQYFQHGVVYAKGTLQREGLRNSRGGGGNTYREIWLMYCLSPVLSVLLSVATAPAWLLQLCRSRARGRTRPHEGLVLLTRPLARLSLPLGRHTGTRFEQHNRKTHPFHYSSLEC